MLQQTKKGFTLIELLVVITIIGILATWAVSVYTSQIQKARDTTRIQDVSALKAGIEQYYWDNSEYPGVDSSATNYFSWVISYVPRLPKDPKSWQACNKWPETNATACDYIYAVSSDSNWIIHWEYKVSTGFENGWNIDSKAKSDWWSTDEENRYELGLNLTNWKSTICDRTNKMTVPSWISVISTTNCLAAIPISSKDWALMIAWN